jgi:DNA-directed RNA polymerase specialized sigma24 family protein
MNVRRAVKALPPAFRSVIELHDFEGLSLQDTAKFLHLTVPAVKSRHFRARKHLVSLVDSAFSVGSRMHREDEKAVCLTE